MHTTQKPRFESNYLVDLLHYPSGEKALLVAVDDSFAASVEDIDTITKLCNEPAIYELLFKDKLDGAEYSREKAEGFIDWAKQGWQNQSHFVFLLRDGKGEISAAIDIKSANLAEAEIGYWASAEKPGYMTNMIAAIKEIAKTAEYQKLFALVRPGNNRSLAVLERNSFKDTGIIERDGRQYHRLEIEL